VASSLVYEAYSLVLAGVSGVWTQVLKFSPVTSNIRMLVRRIKHELVIRLIAHMETNL
jgi:hypothetical protein